MRRWTIVFSTLILTVTSATHALFRWHDNLCRTSKGSAGVSLTCTNANASRRLFVNRRRESQAVDDMVPLSRPRTHARPGVKPWAAASARRPDMRPRWVYRFDVGDE